MKRASNIKELANNLSPGLALEKNRDTEQYVAIYEDILSSLRDRILNDQSEARTYFVAGQSGTGKTTALNFLPTSQIEESYDIRYIYARDLLDPLDIDIIDLLLMLAFKLVEGSPLESKYYKRLDEMRQIHEGTLEKEATRARGRKGTAGAEVETGAKFGFFDILKLKAKFFADYKLEAEYRQKVRQIFRLKKPDLLKLLNDLIHEHYGRVHRKVLFIIDDLDKLRSIDQIKSVFIDNRFYYLGIECAKIIAIPVHLTNEPEITNLGMHIPQFVLSLKSNPIDPQEGEHGRIERGWKLLEELVSKRVEPEHVLIEQSAIDEAIQYSGGILRQYMEILYYAAAEVRRLGGPSVRQDDVKKSWAAIKTTMDRTVVSAEKIELLNRIRLEHTPGSVHNTLFIDCLLNNQIISCTNGTVWYEVNPIIEKTVQIYVAKQEKTKPSAS